MSEKDELIKTEILREAQKLFVHYGWSKTTMEDIAKAAGKGKSTLYYYYKSKEQIFDNVVTREMEEVFRITNEEVQKAQTAEEKLMAIGITKFRAVQKKANLFNVIRGEIEANIQHIMELKRRYEAREISMVRSILKFGLERGEFSHYTADDVDAVAFSLVCAFKGIEIGLLIENKFADFEGRMGAIHSILMNGLKA
ncbi:TetR family transcriptional regulator [Pontibacter actiniarum]|uniref:TetR family transcriptional regulator n=1 Tax=Pontibacter actiniarum TaxID=323450 RepID=A0A1X9YQR8_9BACT|nr:TetR family transcriptional regulator [Pontibacter actiniarum]